MHEILRQITDDASRAKGGRRRARIALRMLHAALAMTMVVAVGSEYIEPVQAGGALTPASTGDTGFTLPTARPTVTNVDPDPGSGYVRLRGEVPDAAAKAAAVAPTAEVASQPLTLTLVLKRDDPVGFDRYLKQVYDPRAPAYRHFLSQKQITARFGPSRRDYDEVLGYLHTQGFELVSKSRNRMTLVVRGTRAAAEGAFQTRIVDYAMRQVGFFANQTDPALPIKIAAHVDSISGLSNLAMPTRIEEKTAVSTTCLAIHTVDLVLLTFTLLAEWPTAGGIVLCKAEEAWEKALSATPGSGYMDPFEGYNPFGSGFHPGSTGHSVSGKRSATGKLFGTTQVTQSTAGVGQTIGLLEFDSFYTSDIADYIQLYALGGLDVGSLSNLSSVPVNGGVVTPGAGEPEVLLDIVTAMSEAPGAKVVVYEAPFDGSTASYAGVFNAMINGGVTVISNSWASCEDQVSAAEATSIDTILKTAAASGISVFNGTGDSGSTCLDGSPNTIAVPADSPNATAVGGTSLVSGPGKTYGSETYWNGTNATPATGQGGYGVSKFFAQPSYQAGFGSATMRSVPDVAINADPAQGVYICEADAGGCPTGYLNGGTSMAAPEWAGFAALLNEAAGHNLGNLNTLIYPLAQSNGFHSAASMGSDFAHVGLGSPNVNVLAQLLTNATPGAVDATRSETIPLVQASEVQPSGAVSADGTAAGGVLVKLMDAGGNTISGKTVTLTSNSGSVVISPASGVSTVNNGTVVFTVSDLTAEAVTFTATDTTDGTVLGQTSSLTFTAPTAASGNITANPTAVPADGTSTTTLVVTLKDALNRPSPGKTVTIADAGAHAVITGPTPGVTDVNGQIQFTATDQINETVTFTATDVTDNDLVVPGSATVTYSGSAGTACGVGTPPVAGSGYTVTPYITGLPYAANLYYGGSNIGCPGGNNPAFTSAGNVLVSDFLNGNIYQTALAGGAVSTSNVIGTLTPALGPLVYGKDGSLYATVGNQGAQIVQVDPTTGAQLRVVASGLTCPAGLAVDPLSGDLFFDDECTNDGTDNPSIFRVIDPANTNSSAPTSVVVYATLPATPNGGMAFAPNGTLYAVSGYYYVPNAQVEQISGTNASAVTVTPVTGVTSTYAIAVGTINANGSAQSLIVTSAAGAMSQISIANPSTATVLVSANSPGVGIAGPDGCLYATGLDTIYRIANSTGGCSFSGTSPAPSLAITPASVSPNPAQGTAQTFTATLQNVDGDSGIPVTLYVGGANSQIKVATSGAAGTATFAYTGVLTGGDSVFATATVNGVTLMSNTVPVTWTAGAHATFLSLNSGPQGGAISQPVTVVASLTDIAASPAAGVSGQTVTLSLDGASCTATTNSAGSASCSLTPTQSGSGTLTATFAGTGTLAASKQTTAFNVSGAANLAPTVSISVSPTNIATGSSAKLTWASANATSCTASGAWNGSEGTSGTQTVTPPNGGSYAYTLTCTGAGGSASATAVLAATLVGVTVTAKSGGGAITWPLLLVLGLLLVSRLRVGSVPRRVIATVCLLAIIAAAGSGSARADQFYAGVRAGVMPIREDATSLQEGLTADGYDGFEATTHTSGTAETAFVGYEFNPLVGVELSYTHRDDVVAQLHGNLASTADVPGLLQDTTHLLRGYGNIVSLAYSARFEVAPRFSIEPRVGGFFWSTKVTAAALDDAADTTHEGGGVTVGATAAYRVWRGLELGVAVDHFRGFPNNVATFYGVTLEWRFDR